MSEKINIAFFDAKPYDQKYFDAENRNYQYGIKYFADHLTLDTAPLAKGCKAVCVFVNDTVSKEVIDVLSANGVGLIAMRCAGYNNVDLNYALNRIPVVRVPAYSPYAVAEHAVALIMTLNRKTHRAYYRIKDNNFSINGLIGFDMKDKTVGVVGTGHIGRIFIKIMLGFGCRVIAYDPFPNAETAKEMGFEYVSLDELLKRSDIISLHCPLNEQTMHIINRDSIDKMKPGTMLVNTSRGQLVDTAALVAGLKSGRVGSAALDVYEEESEYFFEDHSDRLILDDLLARLNSFNNVLITSHQAFFTREAMTNIAGTTLANIKEFVDGKSLSNEVCYRCGGSYCPSKGRPCTIQGKS